MVDMRGGITDDSIRSSSMLSAIITYDPLSVITYTASLTFPKGLMSRLPQA